MPPPLLRPVLLPLLLPLLLVLLLVSCTEDDGPIAPPVDPGIVEVEARVLLLIKQYRGDNGLAPFAISDVITTQARNHSRAMADGTVPFSHDGFPERVEAIKKEINIAGAGENVAMNSGYTDPARAAVDAWIKSDSHRANIQGDYDLTGVGVAQSSRGGYYLTQIFAKSR
ncbi:MAG: CAP domain-containing protein [Bacteroidetes bacterium]|nr:CAP domain-containing protein [Bacteroidota bacterium]